MKATNVIFVCSNGTHVRTFVPVRAELLTRGVISTLLSLDNYYQQGAEEAALAVGVEINALARDTLARGASGSGSFYGRNPIAVWADVIKARRYVDAALAEWRPSDVVVGNDFGLIEKLVINEAKKRGIRVVLIQDGRLGENSRASRTSWGARIEVRLKRFVSRCLRALGLPYLAVSEYGEGGADLVCATGVSGANILRRRVAPSARLVITGQPRYDRLMNATTDVRSENGFRVVAFTTPFGAVGLDVGAQKRQEEMLGWASEELIVLGGPLEVKPHPRETAEQYLYLKSTTVSPPAEDPVHGLTAADVAIIGMSTVVEEAALVGCVVIVPGERIHGEEFAARLPPVGPYPRFNSREELRHLLTMLQHPQQRDELLREQRAYVLNDVKCTDGGAAAAIAELMVARG
jgi:hypothetical protein